MVIGSTRPPPTQRQPLPFLHRRSSRTWAPVRYGVISPVCRPAPPPMGVSAPSRTSQRFPLHLLYPVLSPIRRLPFLRSHNPRCWPKGRGRIKMALPLHSSAAVTSSSSSPALGASSDAGLRNSSPGAVGENDLLIVGPGVLGRIVAEKWQQENPGCRIFGQTITTDHHDELNKIGIIPSLKGAGTDHQFPFIIFCAPPSRAADYPGDVRLAASNWNGEGSFLFTSSSAVYDRNDNGLCDEDCPVFPIGRSPKTDVLLKAENAVLEVGGCVLRLAGLYKSDRGAHNYWLEKGIVHFRPDHVLNLIHYEDAASLAIAIMKKKPRGQIFMGCDNHPLSRQEIMDCVAQSGKFSKKFGGFTGTDDPLGKRMNNSKTRAAIGWEPKYASFPLFLGLTE